MASGALRCCRLEDWKRVEKFLAAVVSGRKKPHSDNDGRSAQRY